MGFGCVSGSGNEIGRPHAARRDLAQKMVNLEQAEQDKKAEQAKLEQVKDEHTRLGAQAELDRMNIWAESKELADKLRFTHKLMGDDFYEGIAYQLLESGFKL